MARKGKRALVGPDGKPIRSRGRLRTTKGDRFMREGDGRSREARADRDGTAIQVLPPALLAAEAADLRRTVVDLAQQAEAANTRRAYESDWDCFTTFCARHQLPSLPALPSTLALYVAWCTEHAHLKASTIRRRLAAIARKHRQAGQAPPTADEAVRQVVKGAVRSLGSEKRQAAPLTSAELRGMIVRMGDDIRACRDRAMILLAFAGALRRSELCELRREDVKFSNDGMRITVRRAKTDQEGTGSTVAVARGQRPETCPERNLRDWIDRAEIEFGPLFRKIGSTGQLEYEAMTPGAFAKILKARAAAAGVKGTDLEPISPHGLRAGLITEAYRNGAREADIQRHARHSDPRTTRGYVRAEEAMVSTPTKKTGL